MKKVFKLLGPYKWFLLLSIVFSTLGTVMQLLLPAYTKNIMSAIIGERQDQVLSNGMIMLGFTLAGVATSIANTYFSTKTSVGYSIAIRNFIFDKVSHLAQSSIDKIGVSSLVTRTTNDVRQVHDFILNTLRSLIPIPIMLVGGIVMAYRTSPEVLKTSLGVVPIMLFIAVVMLVIVAPMYTKVQKLLDRINQLLREKIAGIRVVRAFNRTKYEDDRFNAANKKLTGLALRAARLMAALSPLIMVMLYGLVVLIMYRLLNQVNGWDPAVEADREKIMQTIPNLSAFIAYFSLIITSIASVIGIIVSIPRATVSGRRVNAIINAVSDIVEPEAPVSPAPEDMGKIEFRGVSFRYPPREPEKKKKRRARGKKAAPEKERPDFSLQDISFSCAPGEVTAIIGITGSGKSTLLNLIPRLYDAADGEVLVNGVNVKQQSAEALMQSIAMVPQQAFLFSGTVADNIRFGNPDATDAEVWRALEIAQVKSFVSGLPDGIDSFVSQAGKNYSGGQKQRLAIARAIVKGAKIILFDDSFSALDLATDARLRASLKESLTDTNLVIVAQRVGTVLNADRILVLDGGRLVGQGTHKELLRTCPLYREIVVTQMSEEALKDAEEAPDAPDAAPEKEENGDENR